MALLLVPLSSLSWYNFFALSSNVSLSGEFVLSEGKMLFQGEMALINIETTSIWARKTIHAQDSYIPSSSIDFLSLSISATVAEELSLPQC